MGYCDSPLSANVFDLLMANQTHYKRAELSYIIKLTNCAMARSKTFVVFPTDLKKQLC